MQPGSTSKTIGHNYHELIAVMKEHQNPKPFIYCEKIKINKKDIKPSESIAFYVAELRRLSEHCVFVRV